MQDIWHESPDGGVNGAGETSAQAPWYSGRADGIENLESATRDVFAQFGDRGGFPVAGP